MTTPESYDKLMLASASGQTHDVKADDPKDAVFIKTHEITEILSKSGGASTVVPTSSAHKYRDRESGNQRYAMIVRRRVEEDLKYVDMRLEINARPIRQYLQGLLGNYQGVNLSAFPIAIPKPYELLFYHRDRIRNDHKSITDEPRRTHVGLLVDFIKQHLGETERQYQQGIHGTPPKISFINLWTLFKPRTVVVSRHDGYIECSRVMTTEYKKTEHGVKFRIFTWRWDYHDGLFGPSQQKLKILPFDGLQEITSLNVCPIDYAEKDPRTQVRRAALKLRGHRWKKLVISSQQEYEGSAWVAEKNDYFPKLKNLVPIRVYGRVVVDCAAHVENNLTIRPELMVGLVNQESEDQPIVNIGEAESPVSVVSCQKADSYEMTDEMALITPARVRGYSLRRKRWALLLVDKLSDITWRPEHYERLQLNPFLKKMVLALTENRQRIPSQDAIGSKGSGAVILLYGPPGSGKTLTAESAAEKCNKPLLAISSGDLGLDPDTAEGRLERYLRMATLWDAVLLLDEADVFLTRRTAGNIARNAFVSIFLRHLEYFRGVIFLTTNRVHSFDSAFQSRLHLSIRFPVLGEAERIQIWRTQLEDCKKRNESRESGIRVLDSNDKGAVERLAMSYNINGRDIGNLIHVAEVIAGSWGRGLTEDLIKEVYDANEKFSDEQGMDVIAEIPSSAPAEDSFGISHSGPSDEFEAAVRLRDAKVLRKFMRSRGQSDPSRGKQLFPT